MSVITQESYESASNMLLTEPISPSSSVTKSPSPAYNPYSREEYVESVHSERVVDPHVYNSSSVEFQNHQIVSTYFASYKLINILNKLVPHTPNHWNNTHDFQSSDHLRN